MTEHLRKVGQTADDYVPYVPVKTADTLKMTSNSYLVAKLAVVTFNSALLCLGAHLPAGKYYDCHDWESIEDAAVLSGSLN